MKLLYRLLLIILFSTNCFAEKNNDELIENYFLEGVKQLENEHEKSVDTFTKIILLDPQNEEAYINRGTAHYYLKNYKLAIKDYTSAIQLNKKDQDAYYNRGITYANLGDYDSAINDYSKLIKIDDKSMYGYNNRGWAYILTNRVHSAVLDFEKIKEMKDCDVYCHINVGHINLIKNGFDSAKVIYLKTFEYEGAKEAIKEDIELLRETGHYKYRDRDFNALERMIEDKNLSNNPQ